MRASQPATWPPAWGAILALLAVSGRALGDPMSTSPEQAYDLGEVPNPRAVAMGGALNALGVSTTALALNPANMPLARVYHMEALAAYSPEARRQTYGLAIVDSVLNSSHVAGGLGGTWSQFDPDGIHRTWTDVRGALALPLGDYLSFGGTVRWLRAEQALGAGPFGNSLASDGTRGALFNAVTFDAGATLSILEGLRIAVGGSQPDQPRDGAGTPHGSGRAGYFDADFRDRGGRLPRLHHLGHRARTSHGRRRGVRGRSLRAAGRLALRLGNEDRLAIDRVRIHRSSTGASRSAFAGTWSPSTQTLGTLSLRYFYDALGTTAPTQNETFQ